MNASHRYSGRGDGPITEAVITSVVNIVWSVYFRSALDERANE